MASVTYKISYIHAVAVDLIDPEKTPSKVIMEFFLNGAELSLNSVNSEKLINH